MGLKSHGFRPAIDWDRVSRPTDPKLRQPIPALDLPVENANQTLNKVVVTLNRAGSNPRNPILSGLGMAIEWHAGRGDRPKGVYVYQQRAAFGPNNLSSLQTLGPDYYNLNLVAGQGQIVTGTRATGAKKTFIRFEGALGKVEKETWVKEMDHDIVALNGIPALEEVDLSPHCVEIAIIDPAAEWLDAVIDFFPTWNDEFQVLHNAKNPYLDPGFLKAYGGSKFVSWFDAGVDAEEGVGVNFNPVTQMPIEDQHVIQVTNVEGEYHAVVRFRSKHSSINFVDVEICIKVIAGEECPVPPPCNPPVNDQNVNIYIPPAPPYDPPWTPDIPGTPTGNPVTRPPDQTFHPIPEVPNVPTTGVARGIITLDGQEVETQSNPPLVKVDRWIAVPSNFYIGGVVMQKLSTLWYSPAVTDHIPLGGDLAAPYAVRKKYTICLDFTADIAQNVCFYTVALYQENASGIWKQGDSMLVAGPDWFQNMTPIYNPARPGFGPGSCGGSGEVNICDNGSCPI